MEYILTFVVLLAAELLYFRIADKLNIIDKPNERSSHTRITLRGGGIIFYLGALAYFIISGWEYPWFIGGLTLIAGISFMDDVHSVPNRIRLLCHFAAMLLMFYQLGLLTEFPWWYIIVALVVCTGIINAYNFMDGINGITGGYSLVVLGTLAIINNRISTFIEPDFLYISLLGVCVFCLFNFRKKAKCFAGDVGSVSIAFIILFALGKLILETGDLSYIGLLAVYGVDSVLTIIHRLMLKENIFQPHRKHAYQLLANELKWPHIAVSTLYMMVQAIIAGAFILFPQQHWLVLIVSIVILTIAYIGFMKRYFKLAVNKNKN